MMCESNNKMTSTSTFYLKLTGESKTKKRRVPSRSSSISGGSSGGHSDEFDSSAAAGNSSIDVESQAHNGPLSRSSEPTPGGRSRRVQTRTSRSATTSSNSNSSNSRPATLVPSIRILLRKIAVAVLTDLDDETLQREDTETILIVITLLKEAMLGIIIAFLFVSFVLFIDHRFLLNLPTARNFRKATFAVMNDRETLRNFEVNAGLKFVDMDEYEGMVLEVAKAENKTKLASSILKTRSKDLINIQEEFQHIKTETPRMLSSLGLDKFCGSESCWWGGKMTCAGRVEWLEKQHQVTKYEAMMSAMQNEVCREKSTSRGMKTREEIREDKKVEDMLYKVDFMLKGWDKFESQFYPDGKWSKDATCSERAEYLTKSKTGKSIDRAQAIAMIETKNCRNLFYKEELETLSRFCKDCMWGDNMTCGQRVQHLKYRDQSKTERTATLMVMESRQSCFKKRFCKECNWGRNMNCGQRVGYLKYREQLSEEKATLKVMETPSCGIH